MAAWQMAGGLVDGSLQQWDCKELLQGDFFAIGHTSLNPETSTQAAGLGVVL